jgi:hypothetical protein
VSVYIRQCKTSKKPMLCDDEHEKVVDQLTRHLQGLAIRKRQKLIVTKKLCDDEHEKVDATWYTHLIVCTDSCPGTLYTLCICPSGKGRSPKCTHGGMELHNGKKSVDDIKHRGGGLRIVVLGRSLG